MSTRRAWFSLTAAAAVFAAACVGSGAAFAADTVVKDLDIRQRPMAELPPAPAPAANAGLAVNATLDRSAGVYRKGDAVVLKVGTTKDAYVWVFDTGTSGKVHQIFPNRYEKNNLVKGGKPVTIPGDSAKYKLLVDHPRGTELLTVVASSEKMPLTQALVEDAVSPGPFQALRGNAASVAKDLSVTLKKEKGPWSRDQVIFHVR